MKLKKLIISAALALVVAIAGVLGIVAHNTPTPQDAVMGGGVL